jgi:hypothetical protein
MISQVPSVDASSTRTISLSGISDARTAATSASTVFSSLKQGMTIETRTPTRP